MGVYSNNRSNLFAQEIEPNLDYYGEQGAIQMMIENYQNDKAIFDAVITNDFLEVAQLQEGVNLTTSLEVVNEGAKEFGSKIKAAIKAGWAKIVGLFKTFIAKLNGVIMRDNKAYLNKYKGDVMKKIPDLKKLKVTWAKPKNEVIIKTGATDAATVIVDANSTDPDSYKAKNLEDDKLLKKELASAIPGCDIDTFANDAHEYYFNEEEDDTEVSSDMINHIFKVLSDNKYVDSMEKSKKETDRYYNELLKSIDKSIATLLKEIPNGDEAGSVETGIKGKNGSSASISTSYAGMEGKTAANKKLNNMYAAVSVLQRVANMLASAAISAAKYDIKQCRRVFGQCVTFNPKRVHEDALLIQAVGEAAEYDIESSFADYDMGGLL